MLRAGVTPTLVERAGALRSEGYIIDFWGAGLDLVEKMGLLPEVYAAGYSLREIRIVDRDGRRAGGFDAGVFRNATNSRFTSLPRSALSATLFRAIHGRTPVIFNDSICALEPDDAGVRVHFEHAPAQQYDLMIGADGLHSTVRRLAFGSEWQFERFLGYSVAAFEVRGYRPRDEDVYVSYAIPGRQPATGLPRSGHESVSARMFVGASWPPTRNNEMPTGIVVWTDTWRTRR